CWVRPAARGPPGWAGVAEPRRVDPRDAVPGREPRPRLDEARVALRDRDRETGADQDPLPRPELDSFAGRQVQPRVPRIGSGWNDCVLAQTLNRQLDQRARRAGSERASAMR